MVSRNPIIVYQMGKVGSLTISESLIKYFKSKSLEVPVYHTHALNNLEEIEQEVVRERVSPVPTLRAIAIGKEIRHAIAAHAEQQWDVISLVREPIGRNVAAFFQNLNEFFPHWKEQLEHGEATLNELQEVFLELKSIHGDPLNWFDNQLKPVIGIDVFANPFPIEDGYNIYEATKRFRLLVIRLEDLNLCAAKAISEFIGWKDFRLSAANLGNEKDYRESYTAFKQLPLPKIYVDDMYSSKYARHFYTESELARLRVKWIKPIETLKNI